ncbi:DUF1697 domain-containing protein [uncultured Psychroserpens sp.]|uniref:DUF1697 domain-containing protein n=1 Tax=uncultured Psychroserpens sp. TaxID=255436 RepID=UPI002608A3DD|nr:DUF1697 domain-containing protein [uncultured Psychroserpens sp.]
MNIFIVLLRGINVGGHKKVPMAELRELLIRTGFEGVRTYIQSGNIILRSSESKRNIEVKIQEAIKARFGFEVSAIAKTKNELLKVFDACPFSKEKKASSYFVLFDKTPNRKLVDEVLKVTYEDEEFKIIKDCLYFYSSAGYGRTKFNMNTIEKKLEVSATSRNYKTMAKLIAMSSENEKDQ